MRHKVAGKRLGRSMGHRQALRRTLLNQLFEHERITTTKAKAQAIRAEAEQLISIAKRALATGDNGRQVHARRVLAARLSHPQNVAKLFSEIAPRYETRPGGYTRTLKMGLRQGDASEMVLLELVDREEA